MLDMKLSRERLNGATTAVYERTVTALTASRDAATCAGLCRQLNGAVDEQVAAAARDDVGVACAPGCNFCCHLRVEVFRHEAAALLHALRTTIAAADAAAIRERIMANAARVDGMSAAQQRAARMPCAFLAGGRCGAHDVRPSACAAYHSLSRERCEHSFNHPEHIGTPRNSRPASLELQVFGTALIEATQAGCKDAAAESGQQELHQTLRSLLADEQA